MNEKRATVILLLIFAAVFVYSVIMKDAIERTVAAVSVPGHRCAVCGDGCIGGNEQCDGTNLGSFGN